MKTIKKNVYYCDFCKKRSLSGGHMGKHEKHCTANPDRECRMCEQSPDIRQIVIDLKERFNVEAEKIVNEWGEVQEVKLTVEWIGKPVTLDEVKNLVNDCPNCTFAIIRQCEFNHHYFDKEKFGIFDYKTESTDYLAQKSADANAEFYRNHYHEF